MKSSKALHRALEEERTRALNLQESLTQRTQDAEVASRKVEEQQELLSVSRLIC